VGVKKKRREVEKASGSPRGAGLKNTASVLAERDLLISILETLSQSRHMDEYLKRLAEQIKKYSGCCCVGIRLLGEDGNIPYIAYTGFSREFYEIESPLCVGSDECMCANVIMGDTRLGLPSYTKGGSFLSNGTTKLLASVSEEVKSQTRNVCNRYGYESVALVPMKHGDRILGLIHLADESENKIPPETVRFLERVGVYIGEALHTFMAEEALQESEKQYRDLYEEAPDAYLSCGVDGIIKRANLRATELLGYSREGLAGRPVSDLYADTPDGKAAAEGVFRRYLAGEEVRDQELEVKRADGSSVWVSLSVRPMRDKEGRVVASRSIMVDITERKRAEEALQKQTHDLGERVKELNCLYGISSLVEKQDIPLEEIFQGIVDLIPLSWQYPEVTCARILLEGEEFRTNNFKETIWKQASDIAVHGERIGSLEVCYLEEKPGMDEGPFLKEERSLIHTIAKELGTIIERKRMEQQLEEYTHNLENAYQELQKLDQLKDDFIGLVSHELRSPMTVITGAINTALTEAERLSPEETRQLLKDAAAESESLSNLLANLLELSRVQAQRLVLYSEAINVKRVIQDAVDKIKRQYSTHTFVINLPRRLPPLQADPLRLERILYNLLENAGKYSPTGGEVRVSAKPQGEHLVIGVSDQGIGISPADQEKLFAPFQRLEKRPSGVRGVGLGLMVCRRLVEAHGGHIWVESEPGHGSTFFFAMPLSQGSPR